MLQYNLKAWYAIERIMNGIPKDTLYVFLFLVTNCHQKYLFTNERLSKNTIRTLSYYTVIQAKYMDCMKLLNVQIPHKLCFMYCYYCCLVSHF
jgi:hypothetical protein